MTETLPLATVVEVPLSGEPTSDKAYQVDGSGIVYRVRLRLAEEIAPAFNPSGGAAPITQAFDVTVVRLDDDGEVIRDVHERVIIAAHTRWTVDEETRVRLVEEERTIADDLMMVIRHLIHKAELHRISNAAVSEYLSIEWGVEPLAPTAPPATPPVPPLIDPLTGGPV